ncbi:tRNA(Glu)-specific nuclease WapA precursor [Planctomycetes bacterium Pan216]|uniref:tRNA(Glu)-specific nuclease WapA n=1 Tax=Kolteria novifilia TaxID=2527975 RepID=A0A518AZY1_9BACT|nr:tRNA(Glu)-specific nuclease WapA precursor [Planctomycetes bacterium Pan216]
MLVDYDYDYNLANELIYEAHHGTTADFAYDLSGQLTDVDRTGQADELYRYDANGNRTSSSLHGSDFVVGANNRLLNDGTYSYTYDNEGNLITKTEIAPGDVTTFTYDHLNRLVAVEERTSGGIITSEVEYTYDVLGRRIAKSVNGQSTHVIYDGENAWADTDATGTVTARYLMGESLDELVARWKPGDGTAWYLVDHLGTVRDLADATGAIVNHLDYTAFGQIIAQTNPGHADRFSFTGREFDAESGLYHYRARAYDAALGRFLQQDPLSFDAGDANLYRYVSNAPTIYTDPTGKAAFAEDHVTRIASGTAAGAVAGGVAGFICGYLDGYFGGSDDPLRDGIEGAAIGWAIGAVAGGTLAAVGPANAKALADGLAGGFGAYGAWLVSQSKNVPQALVRATCDFAVSFAFGAAARRFGKRFGPNVGDGPNNPGGDGPNLGGDGPGPGGDGPGPGGDGPGPGGDDGGPGGTNKGGDDTVPPKTKDGDNGGSDQEQRYKDWDEWDENNNRNPSDEDAPPKPPKNFTERIEEAVQTEWDQRGDLTAEAMSLRKLEGPHKMANPDSALGPNQVRYQATFKNEFTGESIKVSVNYDPATGLFGTIKPSSGK